MKKYASFTELETDIRRAQLESQICKEEFVLQAHQTKEKLYPTNIITNIIGSISSSTLISKIGIPLGIYLVKKVVSKK